MERRLKIGLKDIAEQTGVSSAAVSLVLNNRPGVSSETRRKVHDVAKRLGYQSRQARRAGGGAGLANPLRSVGFYAFGVNAALGHSYYGDILSGASASARDLGARLSFEAFDSGGPNADELPIHAVDGLLLTGRPPRECVMRLQREDVPYVLVCCSLAHLPGDTIGPENVESSYRAISYLAGLGHKRIAYLGGEPVNIDARERYLGYRWAIEDLGLDTDPGLTLSSYFDVEHGECGLRQLLDQAVEFTAVYAASDYLAMGVYNSARDLAIKIPRDLSVCGFDNNSLSETLHPALTTMSLDRDRVGRLAIRRLAEVVADPSQQSIHTRLPAELVERQSCTRPD
ncbi:MAG: LacI family DNA-binding transcriptional regulator [Planctomycetota bacterium]